MLLNLSKKTWTEGLLLQDFEGHATSNDKVRAGLCAGRASIWGSVSCCLGISPAIDTACLQLLLLLLLLTFAAAVCCVVLLPALPCGAPAPRRLCLR
jgi:hypothetical protein